jgi:hypothetical protein
MFLVIPALVLLAALIAWLLLPKRPVAREHWEPEDRVEPIDRAELEAAEREVRERESEADGEESGDDWGPGSKAGN